MLLQISQFISEVDDSFYIDDKGNLYTDFGKRKMSDNSLRGGYVRNNLRLKKELNKKHGKNFARHRLVMLCFCPIENSDKLQVNHKDGNKLNNSLENLEWCSNQENRIHACKNNLCARLTGEENPSSKLKNEDIPTIIKRLLNKEKISDIAKDFNVSGCTISSIKNHRNWKTFTEGIDFE